VARSRGAWSRKAVLKPLAPFLTIERDKTYVHPTSYTANKGAEKVKASARKRKAAQKAKEPVDMLNCKTFSRMSTVLWPLHHHHHHTRRHACLPLSCVPFSHRLFLRVP